MKNIFVASDLHFCHDRGFIYEPRGFSSIEEHDETLIENWNKVVKEEDLVYILGDLMLNDNEKGIENINRLNGIKIVILGNHDTEPRAKLYEDVDTCIYVDYAARMKYEGYNFFLCHYPTDCSNFGSTSLKSNLLNLHGHTHSNQMFKSDNPFQYNVCPEAHNNSPVHMDQVIWDIKAKFKECIDML